MNPVVEPAESGNPAVAYYKVKLDNINGTHVYGQLARPKAEGKYPAVLVLQWAGVYGLQKGNVIDSAQNGWLVLNIMAHDLPFDQPEAYYKKLAESTLKDYSFLGDSSRETSYFLRMFLGCYRAVDYLASRPDWNGKVMVVRGTSQGGFQSLVTAALHPKVTAAMVCVPAGCDSAGNSVGHGVSYPWYGPAKDCADKEKAAPKIAEAARYFDTVNFTSRIKCPTLVALGLIDDICAPTGIFSAYNQIQGPKEVVVMVNSGHQGKNNSQADWGKRSLAWMKALQEGGTVPAK